MRSKKMLKFSLIFIAVYIVLKGMLCFDDGYSLKNNNAIKVVSTVKIGSMGDILMHMPIIDANYNKSLDSYNFKNIFRDVLPYVQSLDYSVINMEGTLSKKTFSGYPCFRCPENIIDDCGFDMFLTANNHSYDARSLGFHNTVKTLKNKNVDFIGTRLNKDDKKYIIKDINGIKIGMANYTYGDINDNGIKSVNGILCNSSDGELLNVFSYDKLDYFFDEQKNLINDMKENGADKIIYYMHWGNEYEIQENSLQKTVAKGLCDLGVDIIIGGHPHVVQPIDVLHSEISNKDTICIYSMGNAISNQRREYMNLKSGHTEDGVMFIVAFTKYSDGNVFVSDVEVLPTWVYLYNDNFGKKAYKILPLDKEKDWATCFRLSKDVLDKANKSYDRTMNIIGEGLLKAKNTISERRIA